MKYIKSENYIAFALFFVIVPFRGSTAILHDIYGGPNFNISFMCIPLLAILMLYNISSVNNILKSISTPAIISLLCAYLLICTIAILHYKSFSVLIGPVYIRNLGGAVIGYLSAIVLGSYIAKWIKKQTMTMPILLSWLFFASVALYASLNTAGGIFIYGLVNYLSISDAFAIHSLFCFVFIARCWGNRKLTTFMILLIYITSSFILFSLVSRTSLYLFILAFLPMLLLKQMRNGFILTSLLLITLLSLNPLENSGALALEQGGGWWSYERMGRIFLDPTADNSFLERMEYMSAGLSRISDNLIFGDYMGSYLNSSAHGLYIHNYLSLLQEYGLIVFILFALAIVLSIKKFASIYLANLSSNTNMTLFLTTLLSLIIFIVGEIVTSRAYWYTYVWLIPTLVYGIFPTRNTQSRSDKS